MNSVTATTDPPSYPSPPQEHPQDKHLYGSGKTTSVIRLLLNGRVFDMPEETCARIPRLKESLSRQREGFVFKGGDKRPDVTENTQRTRRHPRMQCWSLSDVLVEDLSMRLSHGKEAEKTGIPTINEKTVHENKLESSVTVEPSDDEFGEPLDKDDVIPDTILRFHRSAVVFESVVDFVENGDLHVPANVCPKLFARDLIFWGFDVTDMTMCCYPKVVSFLEEQEIVKEFHRSFAASTEEEQGVCDVGSGTVSVWRRVRQSAWRLVSDPWTSVWAKMYFVLLCLMILTSFFVMAASTTSTFTRSLTRSEWQDYLGDEFDDYEQYLYAYTDDSYEELCPNTTQESTTPPETRKSYSPRALLTWVQCLSYVSTAFLTLDYLLRLLFCPSLRRFAFDIINISDAIAMLAVYAKYIIDYEIPAERFEDSMIDCINALQLLRVLRFLGPMSKVRGFRVIYFTLRSSFMELLLLFALLAFLVMIFSALLFYLGDRASMSSIPVAMWYSLVTMTTVGYGDVVPKSFKTKLIGSLCTIMGVIFLAMTLPIVVNNFFSLYTSCSVVPPSLKRKKSQKDVKN